MPRNRRLYFLLIIVTIGIGLLSRKPFIPALIYPYLGDMLYTLMFYFIFGFLFPKLSPLKIAAMSIGLCYLIEFAQLYQADWIVAIRQTRLGGLILGHGFLWSDLVSYFVGGMTGVLIEFFIQKQTKKTTT